MRHPNQSAIPSQATPSLDGAPDVPAFYRGYRPDIISDTPQSQQAREPAPRIVTRPTHTFRSFTRKIENTAQTLLTANEKRRYLFLQNTGTGDAEVAFGSLAIPSVAGGANSIILKAGTSIAFEDIVPNNDVSAICTPTTTIAIIEGVQD